jgi:phosphoribosyl 1,2-cyclic phosphodiesterase
MSTEEIVSGYMRKPYFPVGPNCFRAALSFRDFRPGDGLEPGNGVRIRTGPLNHPGGAVGYRIQYGRHAICYITDTEHVPGKPDRKVLSLIEGADVVIYDASYTDEDFKQGFGHSTWQEGARLCDAAGADQLVAFHHMPENDDRALEAVEAAMRKIRPRSTFAREGMIIAAGKPPA